LLTKQIWSLGNFANYLLQQLTIFVRITKAPDSNILFAKNKWYENSRPGVSPSLAKKKLSLTVLILIKKERVNFLACPLLGKG